MTEDVNSPRKWEADYARKSDGWDLSGPTPIFKRLLLSQQLIPGRMIVLGAGRGHDAREFARETGFRSRPWTLPPRLCRRCIAWPALKHPWKFYNMIFLRCQKRSITPLIMCLNTPAIAQLTQNAAAEYADLVTRLLKPNGIYIDLAFPLDGRKGGPPFAVTESEIMELFQKRGFKLVSREKPAEFSLGAPVCRRIVHLSKDGLIRTPPKQTTIPRNFIYLACPRTWNLSPATMA